MISSSTALARQILGVIESVDLDGLVLQIQRSQDEIPLRRGQDADLQRTG